MQKFIQIQRIYFFVLSLVFCGNLQAQEYCKLILDETSNFSTQNQNRSSQHCDDTANYAPDPNYLEHTPISTIYVNFHYILDNNGEGNFQRPEDTNATQNGVTVSQYIVNECNSLLANLNPYNLNPNTLHIPDARFRFEIYTEDSNPNDVYGGIWFHDSDAFYDRYGDDNGNGNLITLENTFSEYGDRVIDLFHFAGVIEQCGVSGAAFLGAGSAAKFCGMFYHYTTPPNPEIGIWNYDAATLHEVGHTLGLDHSYFCGNPCRNAIDDLNSDEECNNPDPTIVCDSHFNGESADCPNREFSGSHNFMKNGFNASNYTPCQLGIIHSRLFDNNPDYLEQDFCEISGATITINSGEDVEWNSGKRLKGNLIIKNNAHLTIKCTVGMPKDAKIIVEKGGKLTVDGGTITKNCDDYWKGIEVWGDPNLS